MYLRSVELDIRAAVDPYAKAAVVIAFEQEAPALDGTPGEGFGAEPEEAYLDLVALPWRLSGRVGKFKMPFGIVNRTHPHDLPWVEAPPGLEALGEEGYNDTGGTLSWILPAGPVGLTFTGGVMSGEPWEEAGGLASPAALGRAEAFASFGHLDLSLGASAIEHPGLDAHALGADLSLRVRPNTYRSFVLLAELVQGTEGGLGGYAAVQVQPSRSLYLGLREDWADDALQHNAYLSYYTSEFLRMRVGASYAPADDLLVAQLQTTFVWGSHPTEPWWVNR